MGFEVPYSIDTDDNGNMYLSGVHDGCDFDPGPGVFNLFSAGAGNFSIFEDVSGGTLQVLGASHPYSWRLIESNILEVRFDPLFLQDSLSNEPASKGFFSFLIRPRSGLQLGDQILNRAAIYFDYNAPVITAYSSMAVAPEVSGASAPLTELACTVFPNPVASGGALHCIFPENNADIRLLDVYGRQRQYWQAIGSDTPLQLPDLPTGLYWLQVQAGKQQAIRLILLH
jgi:hypothetical protein